MGIFKRFWARISGQQAGTRDADADADADAEPGPRPAAWLPADDPGNPWPFPILDLMSNLDLTSVTTDPAQAQRAGSWRAGDQGRLEPDIEGRTLPCALEYRAGELPEGMLFVPRQMEDKWVIAWRDGRIIVARSWTGHVDAVASARLADGCLRVSELTVHEESMLTLFGEPVSTFDWLIKTHALGERVPLPCDEDTARALQRRPMVGFSAFGRHLFCAAVSERALDSSRSLASDGALVRAIGDRDVEAAGRLLANGHSPFAPSTWGGYPPLHLAIAADVPLVDDLLSAGADVNQRADKDRSPLHVAVVHDRDRALLERLIEAGADIEAPDAKGHRPLHAAAEVGAVTSLDVLFERGAELESRTHVGCTALHIACALGHLDMARALVERGADLSASCDFGTPLDVARQEGQGQVVTWLEGQLR